MDETERDGCGRWHFCHQCPMEDTWIHSWGGLYKLWKESWRGDVLLNMVLAEGMPLLQTQLLISMAWDPFLHRLISV